MCQSVYPYLCPFVKFSTNICDQKVCQIYLKLGNVFEGWGHAVAEGRGIDSRWCHGNFSLA
jgi:hypothetical protein